MVWGQPQLRINSNFHLLWKDGAKQQELGKNSIFQKEEKKWRRGRRGGQEQEEALQPPSPILNKETSRTASPSRTSTAPRGWLPEGEGGD